MVPSGNRPGPNVGPEDRASARIRAHSPHSERTGCQTSGGWHSGCDFPPCLMAFPTGNAPTTRRIHMADKVYKDEVPEEKHPEKTVDLPPYGPRNPDPLTDAPGSHPIETGIG